MYLVESKELQVLADIEKMLNNYKQVFESEQTAEVLLKNLQCFANDGWVMLAIKQLGQTPDFIEMQKKWIFKIKAFLLKQFPKYEIQCDDSSFPVTIKILIDNDVAAEIDIYHKTVSLPECEAIKKSKAKIIVYEKKLAKINNNVEELQKKSDNLIVGNKNDLQGAFALLFYKPLKRKLMKELNEILDEKSRLERTIDSINMDISRYDNQDKDFQILQEHIGLFFKNGFSFHIIEI